MQCNTYGVHSGDTVRGQQLESSQELFVEKSIHFAIEETRGVAVLLHITAVYTCVNTNTTLEAVVVNVQILVSK